MAAVMAGSPPRSSSSGSVPDYIGDDLGHALSTPERLRPDSAWCATAYDLREPHRSTLGTERASVGCTGAASGLHRLLVGR